MCIEYVVGKVYPFTILDGNILQKFTCVEACEQKASIMSPAPNPTYTFEDENGLQWSTEKVHNEEDFVGEIFFSNKTLKPYPETRKYYSKNRPPGISGISRRYSIIAVDGFETVARQYRAAAGVKLVSQVYSGELPSWRLGTDDYPINTISAVAHKERSNVLDIERSMFELANSIRNRMEIKFGKIFFTPELSVMVSRFGEAIDVCGYNRSATFVDYVSDKEKLLTETSSALKKLVVSYYEIKDRGNGDPISVVPEEIKELIRGSGLFDKELGYGSTSVWSDVSEFEDAFSGDWPYIQSSIVVKSTYRNKTVRFFLPAPRPKAFGEIRTFVKNLFTSNESQNV